MKVWIDQDLCTGDGLCAEICPEVFVMRDDGLAYVQENGADMLDQVITWIKAKLESLDNDETFAVARPEGCDNFCNAQEQVFSSLLAEEE